MSKRPERGQNVGRAERAKKYEEFSGAKLVDRSEGNVSIKPGVNTAVVWRQMDEATAQLKAIRQALTFSVDNILCATKDEKVYEIIRSQLTPEELAHVHFINFG